MIRTLGLAVPLALAPALAVAQAPLRVEGTEFVLTTSDGRSLRSADLQGVTLQIGAAGRAIEITIQSVEEDSDAQGGRVMLHHFVTTDASGGMADLCAPDADGRSRGFPVPNEGGGFDLTCTSGAVGKCIRWGYRPWEERPGGAPLRALHRACVHMARADYGGDGQATTREGTKIHVYDRFGIRARHADVAMEFEAAWGVEGAVCVARPRIAETISLDQLGARYPWLQPRLGPAACTEDSAMADPRALLFNRSWK